MNAGWKTSKLGDICLIQLGGTPARKIPRYWDPNKSTNNVWLSIADIPKSIGEELFDSKEYLSDAGVEKVKLVKKGTLLMSFKLSIGRVCFAGRDLRTNEAIAALDVKNEELINKRYLSWYLAAQKWDEIAAHDQKLKGKTLNKAKLKEIAVLVPPLPEQERIVAILDVAFECIGRAAANAKKNVANARELFEIALKASVTGELTKSWRKKNPNIFFTGELLSQLQDKKNHLTEKQKIKKEKPLPPITNDEIPYIIPKEWEWCRLGKIGNAINYPLVDGPFGSSINTKTDYVAEGIPVLRMMNVKPFRFIDYPLKYVEDEKYQQFTRHNVLPGDVLFSKVGTIGEVSTPD